MSNTVTFTGITMHLEGTLPGVGDKAPDFSLADGELKARSLGDYSGRVLVLVCVPSLDTPVCDMEVRRFNKEAAGLSDKVAIIAVTNCSANWWVALVAILIVVCCNIWGKGMVKIIPILLGVVGSYVFSMIVDPASREHLVALVSEADWIGLPIVWDRTALSIFGSNLDHSLLLTSIVTIMPISLATMMEHVGDICAISSTVGKNFVEDPGLHRTLVGDGLATTLASLFGAPANTTYGENTGVLALSKVYDPKVIRLAAVFAIVLSFCPKFAALIVAMPAATMGGVSLVLYGMISAVGVRNVVENQVDFTKSRNVLIAAMIMGLAVGVNYAGSIAIPVGSVTISLSGLAVAALVGILMNAVLPGKDYEFGTNEQGDTAVVNFGSRAQK